MMMNISVCPSERFPRLRGLPVFVCVLQPLYGFIAAWAGSVPIGFCERVSLCGFITAWAGMVRRFFWGSLSLVLGAFFSPARQQRLCSCCAACMPCRFRLVALARDCAISRFLRLLRDTGNAASTCAVVWSFGESEVSSCPDSWRS